MTAHVESHGQHLVNHRILVRYHGQQHAGRISSIHRPNSDVEYVVRLDADYGGMGVVVNIWASGRRCSVRTPALTPGHASNVTDRAGGRQ